MPTKSVRPVAPPRASVFSASTATIPSPPLPSSTKKMRKQRSNFGVRLALSLPKGSKAPAFPFSAVPIKQKGARQDVPLFLLVCAKLNPHENFSPSVRLTRIHDLVCSSHIHKPCRPDSCRSHLPRVCRHVHARYRQQG